MPPWFAYQRSTSLSAGGTTEVSIEPNMDGTMYGILLIGAFMDAAVGMTGYWLGAASGWLAEYLMGATGAMGGQSVVAEVGRTGGIAGAQSSAMATPIPNPISNVMAISGRLILDNIFFSSEWFILFKKPEQHA